MSEQQLDLFDFTPRSVFERCANKYGAQGADRGCIVIFDENYKPVRTEWCRDWCPLLNERIE